MNNMPYNVIKKVGNMPPMTPYYFIDDDDEVCMMVSGGSTSLKWYIFEVNKGNLECKAIVKNTSGIEQVSVVSLPLILRSHSKLRFSFPKNLKAKNVLTN